jgi:hypothetical protein
MSGYEKVFSTAFNNVQQISLTNLTPAFNEWHFSIDSSFSRYSTETVFFQSLRQTARMGINTISLPQTTGARFTAKSFQSSSLTAADVINRGTDLTGQYGLMPLVGYFFGVPNSSYANGNIEVDIKRLKTSETNGALFSIYSIATYCYNLSEDVQYHECFGVYPSQDTSLNHLDSILITTDSNEIFNSIKITAYGRA